VGGFVENPQTLARHDSRREFSGEKYYFERQLQSLTIGLAVNINPFQSALGSLSVPKVGDAPTRGAERLSRRFAPYQEQLDSLRPGNPAGASDRLVYGAYRQYAKTWLDSHDKEDKGIHLFFWNNRSHLAVTSANKETSHGKRYWERRYFIVLFNRKDVQVGEVDVSFGMRLPATGEDHTRAFCALTRTFDAIAASIQHDPAAVAGGRELVVPLLVKTWLSLHVIGNWLSFMAESPAARPAYLYAGLSGLFSMDLLLSLLSPRFRNETAHLGSSLGPRFRVLPTFGRALDRVWDAIVGTLATIGLTFIGGVVNVVALMIAAVVLALSVPVPTQPHAAWFGYGAAIYLLGFASRSTSSARRRQRDSGSSPGP
jgi:hypothetical protein